MVLRMCEDDVFFIKFMDFSVSLSRRVSNIQQQLAQFESESWPGMAEADRDRLQLIKEKEALLQELQLIIQQRRPAEDVARLEEERRRLEEEIQRSRATSVQGATERWAGRAGGAGFQRRSSWQSRSLVTQAATARRKVEGAGACRPQGVPRAPAVRRGCPGRLPSAGGAQGSEAPGPYYEWEVVENRME